MDGGILLADIGIALAAVAAVAAAVLAVVRRGRERRRRRELPDLTALDMLALSPESGVWRITPPTGSLAWQLFPPGTPRTEHGFIAADPVAEFDAYDGPGRQRFDDPAMRLEQIAPWARPWVEQVSGRRVVELHEGWGAPYGERGEYREYVVFALTEDAASGHGELVDHGEGHR